MTVTQQIAVTDASKGILRQTDEMLEPTDLGWISFLQPDRVT